MSSIKKRRPKGQRTGKGPGINRFKGLFIHLLAFSFVCIPLAILLLLPVPPVSHIHRPIFEDFSKAPSSVRIKPKSKKARIRKRLPLVAIIIDDMGYDYRLDKKFMDLEAPLSFAFLPYAPNTKKLARMALLKKRDVLVHVPMEPENGSLDPGPGELTVDMDLDTLVETLLKDIRQVPGAVGINNHMGSRFTANKKAMEYTVAVLKQKGLFLIDSRTTKKTVAYEVAKQMGLRSGERSVFLDHVDESPSIEHEIKRLVELAQRNGHAIGIGHPYENTYKCLYRMLPLVKKKVRLVPVHKIVH